MLHVGSYSTTRLFFLNIFTYMHNQNQPRLFHLI